MTVHQCPKCELKFSYKTEVDDHCRQDHPEFRHDYPAVHRAPGPPPQAAPPPHPAAAHHAHIGAAAFGQWLQPARPRPRRSGTERQRPAS